MEIKNISDYKKSIEELNEQYAQVKELQEEEGKKDREIRNNYWDLKREIEEKEREEQKKIKEEYKQKLEETTKNKEELQEEAKKFNNIIELLKLKDKKTDLNDFKVYFYDYPRDEKGEVIRVLKGNCWCYPETQQQLYKPIETFYSNDFLLLKSFITTNKKPKNCYSLIIAGNTFFNSYNNISTTIKELYHYGIDAHTDKANIKYLVKDFDSRENALNYYNNNKNKILKDYLLLHKEQEELYLKVLSVCNNKDWKITILEKDKYYYENNYSRGIETQEYKEIIKKLEELK